MNYRRLLLSLSLLILISQATLGSLEFSRAAKTRVLQQVTGRASTSNTAFPTSIELPTDCEWLNTAHPAALSDYRGRFVLVNFWTMGSIHSFKAIEDIQRLQLLYPLDVAVIGVHVPHWNGQKSATTIGHAINQLQIDYPVVNDSQGVLSAQFGVQAAPTTILIDPQGVIVNRWTASGNISQVRRTIETYIAATPRISPALFKRLHFTKSPLLYPKKISSDTLRKRLIISDTHQNRILITSPTGIVHSVIGNGRNGFKDGDYRTAEFSRPGGTVVVDSKIYVADTGNDAIRVIDLNKKTVTTLATKISPRRYPTDIAYANGKLFVTLAGQHQVIELNPTTATSSIFAGTGTHGRVDGPRLSGQFAQLSGISAAQSTLFVSEENGSRLRTLELSDLPLLETLSDSGSDARQGIFDLTVIRNQILIADAYNHQIGEINLISRKFQIVAGNGSIGATNGPAERASFNSPSGICVLDSMIFVADTNNHLIRRINPKTGTVDTLKIDNPKYASYPEINDIIIQKVPTQTISDGPTRLTFRFYSDTYPHLNHRAPNVIQRIEKSTVAPIAPPAMIAAQWPNVSIVPSHPLLLDDTPIAGEWIFEITLYTLSSDRTMPHKTQLILTVPYVVTPTGPSTILQKINID